METIKEAKSDGQQSQLEEADKPMGKLLFKADVFIPCMVVLITDMAIFLCSGFHYLLAAMKAKGLSFNTIVVYFSMTIVLVITKAWRTRRRIVLAYLTSAVFVYLSSLAALFTVMPSWLFITLCFLTVAPAAFDSFLLLC
ncbi:hypothetical protein SUGI_1025630 [Cryptomeria japonica]|nr:hypothetical protein SUGI_1025630 [Cryptomeria japonica]